MYGFVRLKYGLRTGFPDPEHQTRSFPENEATDFKKDHHVNTLRHQQTPQPDNLTTKLECSGGPSH